MHFQSRLSILILVVFLTTTWSAVAGARGAGTRHPSGPQHGKPVDHAEKPSVLPNKPGERFDGNVQDLPNRKQRRTRGCRNRARRNIPGGCYLSGDTWVEDIDEAPPAAPRQTPTVTTQPSSKPLPSRGNMHVIPPSGNEALKEELIAARRNWLEKKQTLDDASAARARAEYQAQQGGGEVDPALIEQQRLAQEAAVEAQAAIDPVVERARKAGFAPEVLNLYQRANQGY